MERGANTAGARRRLDEGTGLSEHAFRILEGKLRAYGNLPGELQLEALWWLLSAYSQMAHGQLTGRFAFPFPCGTGKTQSIVAFAQALAELEEETDCHQHISMAVSASKVEALCDLKRDLISSGVPEHWVGLYHSYKHNPALAEAFLSGDRSLTDGYATEPCDTGLEDKRILLCTHNRVRKRKDSDSFNIYRGHPRSLLVYDESLFKSEARVIRVDDLRSACGHFRPYCRSETMDAALNYIDRALTKIKEELNDQQENRRPPRRIELPEIDDSTLQEYRRAFNTGYENTPPVRNLLAMSGNPIRVVSTQQGSGLISYDVVVSPDLENIIILDASHNIRDLLRYDKSITRVPKSRRAWISYKNLRVHQMNHCSGRHSIDAAFRTKRNWRLLSLEIYEVIKDIPEDEGVLFFVFKRRRKGIDFEETLRSDLAYHGINMDAKVMVRELEDGRAVYQEKDRFNFLTWGNETSLSSFSFCGNVICVGILHRSHLELGGLIAGQSDNLWAEINQEEIQEAVKGEVNHCLYQALSRGSIRKIYGGETEPMNAWIIDKLNDVPERLKDVLPNAQWQEWKPLHMVTKGRIQTIADGILEYLGSQPEDINRVSSTRIKKDLSLENEPNMTVTEAIRRIGERWDSYWFLEGRSLVRFRPFATADS